MMEHLEQYYGSYDEANKLLVVRVDAKGLRYDNRTANIEYITAGDAVKIIRDHDNPFNSNNFEIRSANNASLGYLPAELCNALAQLFDAGCVDIASYVEKIGERSRYAKQGVLFVEMTIRFKGI